LLPVAVAIAPKKNCVIPTEAAHSLTVSGAVEGSPHFAFAFVCFLSFFAQDRIPRRAVFIRWDGGRSPSISCLCNYFLQKQPKNRVSSPKTT
jgi:hypothetical protein